MTFFSIEEYTSIFEHLAYGSQLEQSDLEKMFNYCDLFPTHEELYESKNAILKSIPLAAFKSLHLISVNLNSNLFLKLINPQMRKR
jgi:hypothetical protein